MKRKIKISAIVLLSAGVVVGCNDPASEVAMITLVDAVTEEVKTPRQVCNDVAVSQSKEQGDKVIGTVAGGAAGAALGNQIGGGSGKTIATATGTVAGAVVGRKVQDSMKEDEVVTHTETKCHTEYTTSTDIVGYDVTYEFGEQVLVVRLEDKPQSNTFPVMDGEVLLPQ